MTEIKITPEVSEDTGGKKEWYKNYRDIIVGLGVVLIIVLSIILINNYIYNLPENVLSRRIEAVKLCIIRSTSTVDIFKCKPEMQSLDRQEIYDLYSKELLEIKINTCSIYLTEEEKKNMNPEQAWRCVKSEVNNFFGQFTR
jgi:hypothetical protein